MEDIEGIFRAFDIDGNKSVTIEEFQTTMRGFKVFGSFNFQKIQENNSSLRQ